MNHSAVHRCRRSEQIGVRVIGGDRQSVYGLEGMYRGRGEIDLHENDRGAEAFIETATSRNPVLETFVLEPIGDVVFPSSTTKYDMPLPDDVQLETLGFW